MKEPKDCRQISDVDWERFLPTDVATLLFIVEPERVLLIRKKRGLGAGKLNAPGGRLEPGETPLEAAVRETEKEVGVTPLSPEPRGRVTFLFTNGYKLRAHIFVAERFTGTLTETAEAVPIWYPRSALPFEEMWADDALWLPEILRGSSVEGRFIFDEDSMLAHELVVLPRECAGEAQSPQQNR